MGDQLFVVCIEIMAFNHDNGHIQCSAAEHG